MRGHIAAQYKTTTWLCLVWNAAPIFEHPPSAPLLSRTGVCLCSSNPRTASCDSYLAPLFLCSLASRRIPDGFLLARVASTPQDVQRPGLAWDCCSSRCWAVPGNRYEPSFNHVIRCHYLGCAAAHHDLLEQYTVQCMLKCHATLSGSSVVCCPVHPSLLSNLYVQAIHWQPCCQTRQPAVLCGGLLLCVRHTMPMTRLKRYVVCNSCRLIWPAVLLAAGVHLSKGS